MFVPKMKSISKKIFYLILIVICGFPFVSSSTALLFGFLTTVLMGENPFKNQSNIWSNYLLKASVIGLGFGINIQVLLTAGKENIGTTSLFVFGVLVLGLALGKILKVERITSVLISVATAICGGSAIVAVGSVLNANSNQISMTTGVVFLLNALALFIFPSLGYHFELSQEQFGTWAAIAIHDTSSVVGAASKFGNDALNIASITKMLRILWIIPLSLVLVFSFRENKETFKIPLFIIGFVAVSCIHSLINGYDEIYDFLYKMAKQGLVMSLFIIGSNLTVQSLKKVGGKVFLHAIILWITVCVISLIYILGFKN